VKVSLGVHGGLAAALAVGRPPLCIDTDDLDDAAAAELGRLVDAAAGSAARASADTEPRPDETNYEITIDRQDRSTVIAATDTTAGDDFIRLRDWISAHGSQ